METNFHVARDDVEMPTDSAGSITIFADTYRYWRSCGLSHFEARNKAVDYWRKFTRHEFTPSSPPPTDLLPDNYEKRTLPGEGDEWFSLDLFEAEQTSAFEHVELNQFFEKVMALVEKTKHKKFFCMVVRFEGLEDLLNEENRSAVIQLLGDSYPDNMSEMSKQLGYTAEGGRQSSTFTKLRVDFRTLLQTLGMCQFVNGHYSLT